MSLIVIVAGIPGSGKTSILVEAAKQCPGSKVINYGDMMIEVAMLHKIDKDTLRKMPLHQQQRIGLEAANNISINNDGITLIDTHALIKTSIGFCPGIPQSIVRVINPNIIAMVECPPSVILQRRSKDINRAWDKDSLEEIEFHQTISRSFLISCTAISGALYSSIHNSGPLNEAAGKLAHLIQSYGK